MRKHLFSAATLFALSTGSLCAVESPSIGVVNFTNCIADSKLGKQEQQNLESLRNQMASLIENTGKELREISMKFEDTEYLDSLSPKAEEELKVKHQTLQEDLGRYQQQFYQVLNHANYQLVQKMNANIATAAEKIAQDKHLDYVLNREACFYVRTDLDVTSLVVLEMDKAFDVNSIANGDQGMPSLSEQTTEIAPLNEQDDTETDQQAG